MDPTDSLKWIFERINYSNGVLYFLSTLAQCAAAFAALIAVFAVFRLQANGSMEEQAYSEARSWLLNAVHVNPAVSMDRSFIKKRLKDMKAGEEMLEKIQRVENSPKLLEDQMSKPLRQWAILFFISVAALPVLEWGLLRIRIALLLLIVGLLGLTLKCLFDTRSFIWNTLKKEIK